MKGEFGNRLREYYRLTKGNSLEAVDHFTQENQDIAGFISERADAFITGNPGIVEDMTSHVLNISRLMKLGIPRKPSTLIARQFEGYRDGFSLESVAAYYRFAAANNVSPVASATMVNIMGFFGLDENQLRIGLQNYAVSRESHFDGIELSSPLNLILFNVFKRGVNSEDEKEVKLGIASMEEMI